MNIAVIGATGVLGRHVIPRLVERGHQVRAIVRQPAQAERLQRLGVEAIVGDILNLDTLALQPSIAMLHSILQRRSQKPDMRKIGA